MKTVQKVKEVMKEEIISGNDNIVLRDSNESNPEIEYGFEYGLFECDLTDDKFRVKIENDILKLTDPSNNVKNKFIIYFFRCEKFNRNNTTNTIERIDTVIERSERLFSVMRNICNNTKIDSLKAIFVEVFLVNNEIAYIGSRLHNGHYTIVEKPNSKIFSNIKVIK